MQDRRALTDQKPGASDSAGFSPAGSICGRIKARARTFGPVFRPSESRRRKEPHVHWPARIPRTSAASGNALRQPARLGPAGLPRQSPANAQPAPVYSSPDQPSPCWPNPVAGPASLGSNSRRSAVSGKRSAARRDQCGGSTSRWWLEGSALRARRRACLATRDTPIGPHSRLPPLPSRLPVSASYSHVICPRTVPTPHWRWAGATWAARRSIRSKTNK